MSQYLKETVLEPESMHGHDYEMLEPYISSISSTSITEDKSCDSGILERDQIIKNHYKIKELLTKRLEHQT